MYFGNYNDTPVKYRVLDSNTTVFGGTTMLLDCNSILWTGDNPSSAYDDSSKVWADSNIRTYLNWTFLRGNFTTAEQNAIAESFKSSVDGTDGNGYKFCEYISLVGDKIFCITPYFLQYIHTIFSRKHNIQHNKVRLFIF